MEDSEDRNKEREGKKGEGTKKEKWGCMKGREGERGVEGGRKGKERKEKEGKGKVQRRRNGNA